MRVFTWEELESFVRKETAVSEKMVLTRLVRVRNDLDVTGDDAGHFMRKYFEKFKVEDGDFNFHDYFPKTCFNPFRMIFLGVSSIMGRKSKSEPLTLGMLEKAVSIGVWDSAKLHRRK